MYEPPTILARGDGVAGEVVLRRRHTDAGPVDELIVNGAFLMDTAETTTETLLADGLLRRHPAPERVLVGGLGLGFTAAALLADARVARVEIVEIEPLLVDWSRRGLLTSTTALADDPRIHLRVDDIARALETAPAHAYDGILFDVDNGPDFLVRPANAALYHDDALSRAGRALAPGGVLGVWSASESPSLASALDRTMGAVEHSVHTVPREGREVDYHLYFATAGPPRAYDGDAGP